MPKSCTAQHEAAQMTSTTKIRRSKTRLGCFSCHLQPSFDTARHKPFETRQNLPQQGSPTTATSCSSDAPFLQTTATHQGESTIVR